MQLNIYVPKARAGILAELDRMSRESGRQKSELVLEALERYLAAKPRTLGRYHLGEVRPWKRGELYDDRMKRVK